MGLTIHFTLSLPHSIQRAAVIQKLEQLRSRCLDLPVGQVAERICGLDEMHPALRCFAEMSLDYYNDARSIPAQPLQEAMGFTVLPGKGCEPMLVGVVHTRDGWFWRSSCKTQYGNDPRTGGWSNFLRCHLSVVAVLDAARTAGFEIEVVDEGEYFATRDVRRLGRKVADYDMMVAAFMGALRDEGTTVSSPMQGRPDFERLEAEGTVRYAQQLQQLLELTRGDFFNGNVAPGA